MNNFDLAIDHALESFPLENHNPDSLRRFGEYVKLFAGELEILDGTSGEESVVLFGDPPWIKIRLDEGKQYLHLGYQHMVERNGKTMPVQVSAKADIGRVVEKYLASRSEFDALLLVDRAGHVIAQHSSSGVELARVDLLAGAAPPPAAGTTPGGAPPNQLEALRATGRISDVTIGGAGYKFYVQPVQLSLMTADGKEPEEWGLCGLVRLDRFQAASSAISSTYWLMLIAALAALCLAIPLLKVHILSPRERFRRGDGVLVAATTFLTAALLTFGLLDVGYFGYALRNATDGQLRTVAEEIEGSLRLEAKAAYDEIDKLDAQLDVRDVRPAIQPTRIGLKNGEQVTCEPEWACKPSLLEDSDVLNHPYPYFQLIAWTDPSGEQHIKGTPEKGITPFINIRDAELSYYDELERAYRFRDDPRVPRRGVSVIRSPNTGEPLTIFWKALPGGGSLDLTAVSLATTPLSVVQPVLPKDMRFAVIDTSGRVMFHSDATRSLNENFFQESEDDPALRALVLGRASHTLSSPYLGRRHRLYVTPIDLPSSITSFSDPRWSLVVFQDRAVPETINLETLTLAVAMFGAYALALAGAWSLAYLIWPRIAVKWFWPDDRKAARYRRAALLNGGLSLASMSLIALASPAWLLLGAMLISACALAGTFAIVRLSDVSTSKSDRVGWHNDFLLARVSLLFVIAVVPAVACFQVAYTFEDSLALRRGQLDLANELDARTERVRTQMNRVPLCTDGTENCSNTVASFLKRRLDATQFDVHFGPFTRLDARRGLPLQTDSLDRLLGVVHLPYNDTATDLQIAFPGTPAQGPAGPNGGWSTDAKDGIVFTRGDIVLASTPPAIQPGLWLAVGAAAFALFLLVRFAVRPFFVLDLYVPPGLESSGNREPAGNLLIVGPPGSGKTDALRKQSRISVFDVRALAYVEAEAHVPDFAFLGPMSVLGFPPESEPGPSGEWADPAETPTLRAGGVLGIDHLEYRLDDPAFRDRMLTFLEDLLFRRRYRVWIASTREPVDQLRESGAAVDLDRWRRLFQSFRTETVGITGAREDTPVATAATPVRPTNGAARSPLEELIRTECSYGGPLLSIAEDMTTRLLRAPTSTREAVLFEIGVAAEPFYRALWTACSKDQKLALRQLAEEDMVNPRNGAVVAELLRSGLIRRDPTFGIMNETFRAFILQERASSDDLAAWEHEGVRLPWASITTTMLTVALGLVGLLLLTQQQLMDAWVGYVPALAPVVPTVVKLFGAVQRGAKPGAATA